MTRRALINNAALAATALAAAPSEAGAADGEQGVVLTLLHTNDMHGHVWLEGAPQGLTRLAAQIEQVRTETSRRRRASNVVLLDAGDIIHGSPEEKTFKGKPILDAMNALRYDVATAGNHEFDWGQTVLQGALAHAQFPVLSANVRDKATGKPWNKLKPHIVLERGGVRLGIFGVTTLETVSFEWPRTLDGIVFTDPYEAAREAVADLRKANVDVVIALSHLGYVPDKKLAHEVPGIDLIIGGHSHTTLATQVWENDVLIAQTGAYSKALGRIDLIVQPGKKGAPGKVLAINGKDGKWWGHDGVPVPPAASRCLSLPAAPLYIPELSTPDEARTLAAYRPWREKIRPTLQESLTTASDALPGTSDTGETVLGNLLADAIRAKTQTDIALMANSQINPAGLPAGAVTTDSLYRVLGSYTRQHLVIARVPGAVLTEAIAGIAKNAQTPPGRVPVCLSGVTVAADGTVHVAGKPVQAAQFYTVGAAAHVMQDYFYQKPDVTIMGDAVDAPAVRDAAISFLRGHAPLTSGLPDNGGPRWQHKIA